MTSSYPAGRSGLFARLNPKQTSATRRQIVFLRGQQDHLQFNQLRLECRTELVTFLDKCWSDFAIAYRASLRNPAYAGLVAALTQPCNQEWFPHWIVHWHIQPKPDTEPPFDLEDYVLQVERLRHLP